MGGTLHYCTCVKTERQVIQPLPPIAEPSGSSRFGINWSWRAMPLPKSLPQTVSEPEKGNVAPLPQVMAERYRVEHKLGSGAFGTVFLVTDLNFRNER